MQGELDDVAALQITEINLQPEQALMKARLHPVGVCAHVVQVRPACTIRRRISMRKTSSRCVPNLVVWLSLTVCALAPIAAPGAEPARVVLLTGADPIQPAALVQIRAIRSVLEASSPRGAEVFLDAIDGFRFGAENIAPEFLALLQKKYRAQRIDLVIVLGKPAADFALANHARIWPGVPVLLSSVPQEWFTGRLLPTDFAYLPFRIDAAQTLAVAERLQPDAHRLIVVGGVTEVDTSMVDRVVKAAATRPHWTDVAAWIGLPPSELQARLSALDRHTAVVYTTTYRDRLGHRYFPVQLVAPMAHASRAPIYAWYSTYVNAGITAGAMYDLEENGRLTGDAARAILHNGGNLSGLLFQPLPARCTADVSQIERYGLSTSALPPDCILVNAPRSMFREYRAAILSLSSVLVIQAITILALLAQRRSRRLAEADATARRGELARAARFATVGELSASIAHEVGQPLSAILSNAEAAELLVGAAHLDHNELQEILSDMKRDALRANEVVQRLRMLLQKQTVSFHTITLDEVIESTLSLIKPEATRRGIVLDVDLKAFGGEVLADEVQLQQVLLNLSLNGMDAMADTESAHRILSISTVLLPEGVEFTVTDRGSGFGHVLSDTLFEPFYTTKPHGMGLGLSIVRSIVEAHQGRVSAAPGGRGGSVFSIWLPRITPVRPRFASTASSGSRTLQIRPVMTSGTADGSRKSSS
ncbi:ATP-binding protein [Caballeronia sp. LZ033]|uniref:sensor histidine kinase n=1 Tax=Caballeronia sp. LZ033 TaxID=3038566 RepID=UPI0028558D78|nr:ATP-binding protein [Caballeronia sp. LZ033]MDR5817973.1 ATP-binding protein [Caballeronia sp. LZ033]